MSDKRIVEINGVKIEVDLRTAKRVDEFKVGAPVKVLVKKYGDSFESHLGMIVAFDEFKTLPTIVVAYIDAQAWSDNPLKFVYINAKSTETEICPLASDDLGVDRANILEAFDRRIAKQELELKELKMKKAFFLTKFGAFFEKTTEQAVG